MALVCVIVACFFAAISGSGPATVAALGMIIIPAMVKAGYDKASSTALMSTSGAIGIIIPPSITFVIYGSITGTSVGSLFASGIVPGILMGALLLTAMMWMSRKRELKLMPKASAKERWSSFKDAFLGTDDAGYYFGRYLRGNLHTDGSRSGIRAVWTVGGAVHL